MGLLPLCGWLTQPHLASTLATARSMHVEPPTLILSITGLLGIPGPLALRIRLGKYVDLGDLLPEALEWAFDRLTVEKKEEGKKKFSVPTVADWSLAFATYMAVTVHFDPKLASLLAVYMTIVACLAREVPGQAWLRYDKLKFARGTLVGSVLPKQLASSAMIVCCATPLGILPGIASCCGLHHGGMRHLTR